MSSVHITPEEFENPPIAGHLNGSLAGKSRDCREAIVFEKVRFEIVLRPNENKKPAFSYSSGLKSVFDTLRFRDGFVWTVGLSAELNFRFQIPPL